MQVLLFTSNIIFFYLFFLVIIVSLLSLVTLLYWALSWLGQYPDLLHVYLQIFLLHLFNFFLLCLDPQLLRPGLEYLYLVLGPLSDDLSLLRLHLGPFDLQHLVWLWVPGGLGCRFLLLNQDFIPHLNLFLLHPPFLVHIVFLLQLLGVMLLPHLLVHLLVGLDMHLGQLGHHLPVEHELVWTLSC